jgi:DNA-binding response OmpR family regulator
MKQNEEKNMANRFRALVVDDDPHIAALCVASLENFGFPVDVASDGRMGWGKFRANRYHLVVTDLRMPVEHGHSLCQRILGRASDDVQFAGQSRWCD